MNPRGRWRRRRNLRRVPTTSDQPDQDGTRKRTISASHTMQDPIFERLFLKSEPYVHRPARKVDQEKKRTDRQESKVFRPISSSAGIRFWTAKCQIPVANPLKSGSQNDPRMSPKRSNKEHLRLLLGRWHSPQVAPAAQ